MKLCLVMAGTGDGGLEHHFLELCRAFSRTYEVHAIAHPAYQSQLDDRVAYHPLDLGRSRWNPAVLFELARIIRQIRPHILHAHANKAVSMLVAIRRFLPPEARLVGTLHNRKNNLGDFERLDCVIGVSDWVLEKLRHPRKHCIRNGVEAAPERWRDKAYLKELLPDGFCERERLIINLGRLVPAKRVDLSIRAVAGLPQAGLVIVGDGPLREELEALAQELQADNITFLGYRRDAVELLSAADLGLISSDREGFPYVLLEILMAQTPVVATDMSDMKAILPLRYIAPTGDEEALREILVTCLSDFDTVLEDFEPVFHWARENLGKTAMLDKIDAVYQEVMAPVPMG